MRNSPLFKELRKVKGARRRFDRPPQSEVLIYDAENSSALAQILCVHNSVFVLVTRGAEVWLNPGTIWRTATNLLRGFSPALAYASAIVRQVRPHTAITYIDNSHNFHVLASLCGNIRFLAIQNGNRFPYPESTLPPNTVWSSEMALWSRFEADSYCAQRTYFKRVHVTGSLKSELCRPEEAAHGSATEEFDLCVIGGAFHPDQGPEWYAEFKFFCEQLATFLNRNEGLSGCVALRTPSVSSHHSEETAFYRRYLDPRWVLLPRKDEYSSYRAIDASRLSLSTGSSLSIEALGRGKRALIWHPLRRPDGPLRFRSDLILCQEPREAFESRIFSLLKMSDAEFSQKYKRDVAYLCEPVRNAATRGLLKGVGTSST